MQAQLEGDLAGLKKQLTQAKRDAGVLANAGDDASTQAADMQKLCADMEKQVEKVSAQLTKVSEMTPVQSKIDHT